MFSQFAPKALRLKWLTILVMGGFIATVSAESSTGIRLGTTDFGGKQSSRLGTINDRQTTDRTWSRTAPAHRSWSRDDYHHSGKKHHSDGQHSSSQYQRPHHNHDYQRNLGGIQGHPSFGLSTTPTHNHRHHYDHGYYRSPALYYQSPRVGVQVYTVPQVYSSRYESYATSGGTVIRDYSSDNDYNADAGINPWVALGEYQYHTARYAFEAQIQQQPHAALPRVGLSLSTALAGQLDAAAFAMQDALLSDTQDLQFFNADPAIQLILEELLLSYEGDPLMTASLHYLNRDYAAAERAVQVAANYCQPCTAVDNLDALINAQH